MIFCINFYTTSFVQENIVFADIISMIISQLTLIIPIIMFIVACLIIKSQIGTTTTNTNYSIKITFFVIFGFALLLYLIFIFVYTTIHKREENTLDFCTLNQWTHWMYNKIAKRILKFSLNTDKNKKTIYILFIVMTSIFTLIFGGLLAFILTNTTYKNNTLIIIIVTILGILAIILVTLTLLIIFDTVEIYTEDQDCDPIFQQQFNTKQSIKDKYNQITNGFL